ncbi:MAG: hydroxymethylbilane synthase [Microbacteriaceae bacterium]
MNAAIRIGTRGSALAMAQTQTVARALERASGRAVELVPITTHGDTSSESLSQLGGTGVFASALREALLAGDCDLVVHSMKDLPAVEYPGLTIGAVPKRADARDALCARDKLTLATLPAGARVGTGSPRRIAQLREARPDLTVVDIRGNVDTRIGRVHDGDLDAVILAVAGLSRLGRADAATDVFELESWPTAPGQGALAIEVREDTARGSSGAGHRGDARAADAQLARALASISHSTTVATTLAERTVLARLEAGCAAPIGATAMIDTELFFLTATVYAPDGSARITSSHAASLESQSVSDRRAAALDVGGRVADELLAAGAAELAPLKGA